MDESNDQKRIQNQFLDTMRREKTEVEVALVDGENLIGYITDFDQYSIIVKTATGLHLIYNNSVCYIHAI